MILFKIFTCLFILNNLYYLFNYKRLDDYFKFRDKHSPIDLIFYINKVLFIFWVFWGIYTSFYIESLIILFFILLRFPIHFVSKKTSLILHRLTPIILTLIMFYMLFKH
jgi:hypothetical protein